MPFWTTQRICAEQQKHTLFDHFDEGNIAQAAYEMSLSREALTTRDGKHVFPHAGEKATLEIRPGQFALLYTEETVSVPPNAIAFISIKAKVKLKGLVNVSGFHVDPGFKGRLKFSVYNAGNRVIVLEYGRPTFLIWFADLDGVTEHPYNGTHNGQNRITAQDRENMAVETHSPAALDERLASLERRFSIAAWVAGIFMSAIVLPLAIALVTPALLKWLDQNQVVETSAAGKKKTDHLHSEVGQPKEQRSLSEPPNTQPASSQGIRLESVKK